MECRYHLLADWPRCHVDCAIDVVDAYPDGAPVETLGALLGVTHQAVSLATIAASAKYDANSDGGAAAEDRVTVDRSRRYRR